MQKKLRQKPIIIENKYDAKPSLVIIIIFISLFIYLIIYNLAGENASLNE